MKKQSSATAAIDRRMQICRYEILSLDQDVKAKIESIKSSFSGQSITLLNQLSHSVCQQLDECEEKCKQLDDVIKSLPKSNDTAKELTVAVQRYRLEIQNNLKNLRQASQNALKNVEFEERAALLSSSTGSGVELKQRSSKLTNQSAEFSNNLTNLLRAMDVQVKQSEETLQTLVGSSQVISETEFEFRSMGSTVVSSGKLLSKFGRREMTDRILFVLALMFFFGTVFYIVKKRMLTF